MNEIENIEEKGGKIYKRKGLLETRSWVEGVGSSKKKENEKICRIGNVELKDTLSTGT